MISIILRTATTLLVPLLVLFSVFLLLRGHNEPGGGFIGGLVAASAYALYAFAFDVRSTRAVLRLQPRTFIVIGLSIAALTGLLPLVFGRPFLTALWAELPVFGGTLDLGTPLLFDAGVYVAVLGVTLTIILALAEE